MAAQYCCNQPLLQSTTNNGQLLLPTLPEELISKILLWLPIKSLLRFKSVCKSWKTLISDPQFASTQLQFSTTADTSIAEHQLIFYYSSDPYVLVTYNLKSLFENPSTCVDPDIFSFVKTNKYIIAGSCNGLLCLLNISQHRLRLFNHSIGFKSRKSPEIYPRLSWMIRCYGFGYDQVNDKYKFLIVLKNYDDFSGTLTKMYTFGEDSSKTIQNFPCNSTTTSSSGKHVSGTLNWIVHKEGVPSDQSLILSFDLNKETHRKVLLPQNYRSQVWPYSKLCVFRNCLSVIVTEKSHWVVWSMKQFGVVESWTKLMIIPREKFRSNSIPAHPSVDILFISENGVVLLRDKLACKFVLYNLNSGELVYPSLSWTSGFYIPIHRESLESPRW